MRVIGCKVFRIIVELELMMGDDISVLLGFSKGKR